MGIFCFGMMALANGFSLYLNWALLNLGGKLASCFNILFELCLVLFFNYLSNQLPPEDNTPNQEELNKFLEELK